MSTSILPSLAGLGWSVNRSQAWSNRKPMSISGKETAIADWSVPRRTYTLTYNVLRQGNGLYIPSDVWAEFGTLYAFFNQMGGGFDSFLYTDTLDNAVVKQGLGNTDGASFSFPLERAFSGFVEPVLAPNTSGVGLYLNNTLQSTSTYAVVGWGAGTGIISGGTCTTTNTSKTLTNVVLPSNVNAQNNMLVIGAGVPFPSFITVVGPTSIVLNNACTGNASNVSITIVGSGNVAFASPPTVGQALTITMGYYWPCKFVADTCEFEQFDAYRVRVKKLQFITMKN